MKVNKRRPDHWLLLCSLFAVGIGGLLLRLLHRRPARGDVILYGHKLNGNLLALFRALARQSNGGPTPVFLTMERSYARQLQVSGVRAVWTCDPAAVMRLASTTAIITDHGLHSLGLLRGAYQRFGVRFFDVWHGIPFKGFDADDFRLQQRYDETWVASPLMQHLYVSRYGFAPERVIVTGYARTDQLVNAGTDRAAARRACGLDGADIGRIVLFAPTWKQDARQRSIYPFDTDADAFLGTLSRMAQHAHATIVMRTHLNSGAMADGTWPRIVQRPSSTWPDTEALLAASDILVCDWSSIAFDWLLLGRPTVFLGVPSPFAKGFSLGPEYRYGAIVADMEELTARLSEYLADPNAYAQAFGARAQEIREHVYGGYDDGQATRRCLASLPK